MRELAIAGARHLAAVPRGEAERRELLEQLAQRFEEGDTGLDYDRDYDTLAEVMEFESVWLAPAGTLP